MAKKKKFWQNVKPLFFNKAKAFWQISYQIVENDAMIDNESEIFNKYFVNIVKNLRILKGKESATLTENN